MFNEKRGNTKMKEGKIWGRVRERSQVNGSNRKRGMEIREDKQKKANTH